MNKTDNLLAYQPFLYVPGGHTRHCSETTETTAAEIREELGLALSDIRQAYGKPAVWQEFKFVGIAVFGKQSLVL